MKLDFNAMFNRLMRRQETQRRQDRTYISDKDLEPMKVNVKMKRTKHAETVMHSRIKTGAGGHSWRAKARLGRLVRKSSGFIR